MEKTTHAITPSSPIAAGFVSAVLGMAMVLTAFHHGASAWRTAVIEPRYIKALNGHVVDRYELDALTQQLRESHLPRDHTRAAFVQMLAAQQAGLSSVGAVGRLTSAQRDLRLGLSHLPADAYAWTRLAVAEELLGKPEAAARALAMALDVAPSERKLTPLHFDLGVVLWDHLDQRARRALGQRLKWARHIPELERAVEGNSAAALRERLDRR